MYDNRYMKSKLKIYGDKVYTNFCSLNVSKDGVECKSFTIISIDSLLAYEKKYYNSKYKAVNTKMIDHLDDSLSKSDEN